MRKKRSLWLCLLLAAILSLSLLAGCGKGNGKTQENPSSQQSVSSQAQEVSENNGEEDEQELILYEEDMQDDAYAEDEETAYEEDSGQDTGHTEQEQEPLIDEETFALAQKRLSTRHRPTKNEGIDLFSGLLYCADCGHKLTFQAKADSPESKHAYFCGRYRNRQRLTEKCTAHYIRKVVLKELVLADMQRVMAYAKGHEREFVAAATQYGEQAARKAAAQQRKELDAAETRIGELDTLFRKLYEDNALGKLSDEQFALLTSGYEEERKTLMPRIAELKEAVNAVTERTANVKRFLAIVRKYTEIDELTYENVHEFIDRIVIHETDKETNTRKIEIFYSFIGKVE